MIALITLLFCLFPMYPHTEADTQILADVMWLENPAYDKDNQDQWDKMVLTGAVVLNRMESGEWGGNTIREVVFAKGQYAASTKNGIGKTDTPDWVYELAEDMLNYGTNVPDYIVYQSMQSGLGTVWKRIGTEYFATAGGHKNEGINFHPKINSSWGRDIRIFDHVFGNSDTNGNGVSVVDYIRWHGYFRSLCSMAMACVKGGGLLHP